MPRHTHTNARVQHVFDWLEQKASMHKPAVYKPREQWQMNGRKQRPERGSLQTCVVLQAAAEDALVMTSKRRNLLFPFSSWSAVCAEFGPFLFGRCGTPGRMLRALAPIRLCASLWRAALPCLLCLKVIHSIGL